MTAVSVIVPWRPSNQQSRIQSWAWLRPRWEATGWQIIEGTCPGDGPWRKAIAVADGIRRADADILVIADADVWTDGVAEAVDLIAAGRAPWATPQHLVRRLSREATAEVLATGHWPAVRTDKTYAERPYPVHPGGGMTVVTRDGYREAPMDPMFEGWGQEDDAWAIALRLLLGPEHRGTADLWHLWHEIPARKSRTVGSQENADRYGRYVKAAKSRSLIEQLIAEFSPAPV